MSGSLQISEIEQVKDMTSEYIQFFQKLYEMSDNDESKVFVIDEIATAMNFGDITTRKIIQYLTGEELVERVGQQGVRITHRGIVVGMRDLSNQYMSVPLQEGTVASKRPKSLASLRIPEDEARRKIESQIEKGCKIRDQIIQTENDLANSWREMHKWEKDNTILLLRIFDDESMADQYEHNVTTTILYSPAEIMDSAFDDIDLQDFRETVDDRIARLRGVLEQEEIAFISSAKANVEIDVERSIQSENGREIKVFISHRWADGEHDFACELRTKLKDYKNIEPLLDEYEVLPGDNIQDWMNSAIEKGCDVFLFLMSPGSLSSENCLYELDLALQTGLPIIPILVRDCEIPANLKDIMFADFREDVSLPFHLVDRLVKGIKRQAEKPQYRQVDKAIEDKIISLLLKINPLIVKQLDEGKRISVVANSEDYANLDSLNESCGMLKIEPSSNTIIGYHAGRNLGIYTVKDNHGAKVHFYLSFAKELQGTQKQHKNAEHDPQISAEGTIDADMVVVESYKSTNGGIFRILADKKQKLGRGDYDTLFFKVIPPTGEVWNCIIKMNNILYTLLRRRSENIGSLYDTLRKLGTLRIREAIDEGKSFPTHEYTSADIDTLLTKL